METIWETGVCSAAQVIQQLRSTHDWNHSTIRTLLARLVEKGALEYKVDRGPRYIYRAAIVSPCDAYGRKAARFWRKVFGGDVRAAPSWRTLSRTNPA